MEFSGLFFRRCVAQKVSAADLRSKILEQPWFAERRMEFYMRMEALIICAIGQSAQVDSTADLTVRADYGSMSTLIDSRSFIAR
jgi:hypothetical protein